MGENASLETTAARVDDGLRAGLVAAAAVALTWTVALAFVDLRWGRLMYDSALAAGGAWPLQTPYFLEHWQWVLQQGTRVLVGGALAAALVARGRLLWAGAMTAGLALLGPLTTSSPVLGPFAPGPGDNLALGLWANAASLLLALWIPAVVVLLARQAASPAAPSAEPVARPLTTTLAYTAVAAAFGALVVLAPRASSLLIYGLDPETLSTLAAMAITVVASTVLVATAPRPLQTTAFLAAGAGAVSLTSSLIGTRLDTVVTGGVLLLGPAVLLLGPPSQLAWRCAFRHGPVLRTATTT